MKKVKEIELNTFLIDAKTNAIGVRIHSKDGIASDIVIPGPLDAGNNIAVALDALMGEEIPFGTNIKITIEVEG